MVKDAKRFADSGGWGYAVFVHVAASGTYQPRHRDLVNCIGSSIS
jgi:hypothetical protein